MPSAPSSRRGEWWLALLALVCTLGACGERVPPLAPLASEDVVLAFGDSLTYGTGATPEQSYPHVLAALIGREVVGDGVPGELTAAGLARLPESLDEHAPKLLLLCLGGNDMLQRIDPALTESNLRRMVQLARGRGIQVVLIGVPEPKLLAGVADYYADLAEEFALPLEAEVLNDVLKDNALKSDAIHPNADGYRKMAQAVAALLEQAGAIQAR